MTRVFVYGAQMIHPESVGAAWPGRVHDHAVRFLARGLPVLEPAFAALVPAPGELAHGVIVEFEDDTWAALERFERGYLAAEVEVELLEPADAEELGSTRPRCLALFIRPRHLLGSERRPSARYARKLAAGARAHGLPREVVARYERAAAEGGRASLALAWLFPVVSRIGLVPAAIVAGLVLLGLLAGLILSAGGL